MEEQGKIPELTEEIKFLQDEIDSALEEAIAKKTKRYLARVGGDTSSVCSSTPAVQEVEEELNEQGKEFLEKETLRYALDDDSQSDTLVDGIMKVQNSKPYDVPGTPAEVSLTPEATPVESSSAESAAPPLETTAVSATEQEQLSTKATESPPSLLGPRPTAASLGLKDSIEDCMKATPQTGLALA